MTDDISEIVTGASCYAIQSQTTIYAYKANVRYSYIQIGGKWVKNNQTDYTYLPNTYCVSYDTIKNLNSNAAFLPIYEFIALIMAVFVWLFIYRIIRKLWRVR